MFFNERVCCTARRLWSPIGVLNELVQSRSGGTRAHVHSGSVVLGRSPDATLVATIAAGGAETLEDELTIERNADR